ncbi:hypothetical protein TanjilG_08619 [Lupinus angustifolius]|uniref:Uncharacterized protein n=1 Tax=Lupinus angustifolius TaxID=3871 RepID=A0A4P1R8N8_LUPAN|nr:hypothetical protein TanjilG_08619 [Lupinus angustifolius]
MLQPHSCSATTQSSITIPNHTFTPKFIPLSRVSSMPTFSVTLQPLSIRCRHSHLDEPKSFPSSPQAQRYSPPPPSASPASVGALPPRVFVGHSIYKGKAALTVSPKSPEFQSLESGAFKVSKEGSVLLQFAPAVDVQNKLDNIDENIFIPITKAELAVLSSLFNFIMPYLLGWHTFGNSIKPDNSSKVNSDNPRYGGDYEWNR